MKKILLILFLISSGKLLFSAAHLGYSRPKPLSDPHAPFKKPIPSIKETPSQAYLKYLENCKKKIEEIKSYLVPDIKKIVDEYACLSYNDWKKNNKILLNAISKAKIKIIQKLLDSGEADINAKDDNGTTALMLGIKKGFKEIIELLIKFGADVNEKNRYGKTPLMYSVIAGNKDITLLLLNKGSNLDSKDFMGWTPLMWAVYHQRGEIVKLLVEKGANVNAKNNDGFTALMLAVQNRDLETVKFLLENKADVNSRTNQESTALIFTYHNEDHKMHDLLMKYGAIQ